MAFIKLNIPVQYISTFIFSLFSVLTAQEYSAEIILHEGKVSTVQSSNLPQKPKIGLVLSGGGSRGISHIGVIKVLDSLGIVPDLIVGTSIGGVVGGLYAAGYSPKEIEDITKSINWADIFSDAPQRTSMFLGQKSEQDRFLLSLRLQNFKPYIPNAVTPGQKVLNILSDLFLMAPYQVKDNFDDLKIPFRSVATDIVSGNMCVIKDGNLAEALNGSLAVPLLFSPVSREGMLLVDGGIKANLPVGVARDLGMELIIASDVSATLRSRDQIKAPWEVADQVTTIMTNRNNLKEHKNVDVLILPKIPKVTNTDFSKIDSMILAGQRATELKIDSLQNKLRSRNNLATRQIVFRNLEISKAGRLVNAHLNTWADSSGVKHIYINCLADSIKKWMATGLYKKVSAFVDTVNKSLKLDFKVFGQIDTILIRGNTNLTTKEIRDSLLSKKGHALNAKILEQDLHSILSLYRKCGFSLMTFDAVFFNKKNGMLSFKINEGIIEKIDVEGNEVSEDFLVLREFSKQKNKAFNWLSVKKGIDNVYASSLYSRVSADILRHDRKADIIIRVNEKPSIRFQVGGKADIERNFQGYMELADENFMGKGVKLKMQTRLGVQDGLLGLSFRNDRIFTSFLTLSAQTYFTWEINPFKVDTPLQGKYREERLGFRLQLGQQLARIGQLVGEVRIERVKDFQQEGRFVKPQDFELRTFALRSITDKRDRIDFPTKGVFNHWAWENGNSFLLNSQESYTKVLINLEGYYRLFNSRHIGHVRLLGGLGDESLPFSENFRIGGLHSFYGLLDNELFGKQVILTNFEYRYKLPFKKLTDTYFSIRYDLGAIWQSPNLITKSEDFFSGFGGYFGVDTFLGPLYLGWGKASLGRENFYLSLGFNY
jgi:NTE family protein